MFGIETSLFPLSVDAILFEGFLAILNFSALPILYSFLAAMILVLISLFVLGMATASFVVMFIVLTLF